MNKNAGTLPLLLLILVALLGFVQVIFFTCLNLAGVDSMSVDQIRIIGSLVPNILKMIFSLSSFLVSVFLLFTKRFASKWLGLSLTALATIVSINVATQIISYVLLSI